MYLGQLCCFSGQFIWVAVQRCLCKSTLQRREAREALAHTRWKEILYVNNVLPRRLNVTLQVFLKDASGPISPFHDIPYKASDSTFHVVIEIPRCLVDNIKCWIGWCLWSNFVIILNFCQVDKWENGSGHQVSSPPHCAGDQFSHEHIFILKGQIKNYSTYSL